MCGRGNVCVGKTKYVWGSTRSGSEWVARNRGNLGCLYRVTFPGFVFGQSSPYLVLVWGTSLSQGGFQLASSPSCPSPKLRAFSEHVSGQEIHKNAPSQGPLLPLVSHLKMSAGDQLQLLSLGPISYLRAARQLLTGKPALPESSLAPAPKDYLPLSHQNSH